MKTETRPIKQTTRFSIREDKKNKTNAKKMKMTLSEYIRYKTNE